MLTFDKENHKYFWDGKEVPSVTQILKTLGISRDSERIDPFYRDRGTFVHQAIEFHVKGTLDEGSLDPDNVLPHFLKFKDFEKSFNYKVLKSEVPLYSLKYGFAGTIDQLSKFPHSGNGICDIKVTENSDKAAEFQLCLYAQLVHENMGYWPAFKMTLELPRDLPAAPLFDEDDPEPIVKALMLLYEKKKKRRKRNEPVPV